MLHLADVRNRVMIHSASEGSMMIIPRENRLVRLYIQLTEVSAGGGRVDRSKITPELIFKAAQKIIRPYKLEYHYCDWWVTRRICAEEYLTDKRLRWTAYQIGQRISDHFSKLDRVFLAGGEAATWTLDISKNSTDHLQMPYVTTCV